LELGQDESLFGETAKKSSDEKRCNAPCLDCVAESCSCPSLRSLRIYYYYYHYLFGKDGYDGSFDPKKIKNPIHGSGWVVWGFCPYKYVMCMAPIRDGGREALRGIGFDAVFIAADVDADNSVLCKQAR